MDESLPVQKDTKLLEQFRIYLNSLALTLFEFQSSNLLSEDESSENDIVLCRFCFNSDVSLMFMSLNQQNSTSMYRH